MTNFSSLKNILFDLGGVILDLDVNATLQSFYEMGFPKEFLSYPENFHTDLFFRYETGKISSGQFRDAIRKRVGMELSDEDIDRAWTAMLAGVPAGRTKIIGELSRRYDLFILSNTSPIHIRVFEQMYHESAGIPLSDHFKQCFYSHETGFHKPDPKAFRDVLKRGAIKAGETLFLDDNMHNVKAAKELGFHAIHISDHLRFEQLGFDM